MNNTYGRIKVAKEEHSIPKKNQKSIVKAIGLTLIPLAIGGVSALLTNGAMSDFSEMKQPPLSPPGWLFPVAWSVLYLLMGFASYLIYNSSAKSAQKKTWISVYFIQLFFNFCWSPVFFNFKWYWFALGWLIVMWAMIIFLIARASKIDRRAMWLLVPYVLWCTFAAYLNAGIAILN